MGGCLGDAPPSHAPEAITSLPGSEYLFDPAANLMDGAVVRLQPAQRFLLIASPHGDGDDARRSTPGAHGLGKDLAAIGAVGEHLAGVLRKRCKTGPAIMHIGRRDQHLPDQRSTSIRSGMGLEAVDGRLCFVLHRKRCFQATSLRGAVA